MVLTRDWVLQCKLTTQSLVPIKNRLLVLVGGFGVMVEKGAGNVYFVLDPGWIFTLDVKE